MPVYTELELNLQRRDSGHYTLSMRFSRPDSETENWVARDGLVVIPKDSVIADDTVI